MHTVLHKAQRHVFRGGGRHQKTGRGGISLESGGKEGIFSELHSVPGREGEAYTFVEESAFPGDVRNLKCVL